MDCSLLIANFIVSILLVSLSGFEYVFVSSNRLRVELDRSKDVNNKIISFFYKKSDKLCNNYFLLNLALFYAYAFLSVLIFLELKLNFGLAAALFSAVFFVVYITVLLDICFRLMSKYNPTATLHAVSVPMFVIYILGYPFFFVLSYILNILSKNKLGFSVNRIYFDENDNDDKKAVEAGENDAADELRLFRNALDFSNVFVKDCIVPRTEIVAIELDSDVSELLALFAETNCSRILVYKNNIDNVIGYVHSSDMFSQPKNIQSLLNPIIVAQESMAANKLLKIFLQRKKSLALVVDEFGGTAGIITLEDMMEEIFGEIEDEHDEEENVCKEVAKNEFLLSGRLEIDQLNERLGLSLPVSADYQTVAGLLLSQNEILPQRNEEITVCQKFRFKVIRIVSTRIDLVKLKVEEK